MVKHLSYEEMMILTHVMENDFYIFRKQEKLSFWITRTLIVMTVVALASIFLTFFDETQEPRYWNIVVMSFVALSFFLMRRKEKLEQNLLGDWSIAHERSQQDLHKGVDTGNS